MIRRSVLLAVSLLVGTAFLAAIVFLALLVGVGLQARGGPELQAWHRVTLASEYTHKRAAEITTLEDYLNNEQVLFSELEERIVFSSASAEPGLNRFDRKSRSYPGRGGLNFNRTAEFRPHNPRGAVLMLHGMTDGPYSMRHLQRIFTGSGFYVLNLRLPAHGTTPGALSRIHWRDWLAAVELGARHVKNQASGDLPFWIVGYSNGATVALKHALNALEQDGLPIPDRLVLVSPMIGVDPLARFSRWLTYLGRMGFFEKSLWLDILPEYDPHKYNSFPSNAVRQSHELTRELQAQITRLNGSGKLARLPPLLVFQSLADATVETGAVFDDLYARLPDNGSELVVFDVNRLALVREFIRPSIDRLREELLIADQDHYALSLVVNAGPDSRQVMEWRKPAGATEVSKRALGLSWPQGFYSLSHVALPFPPTDEIYGYLPPQGDTGFPWLGWVNWLGENRALTVPNSVFTRARSNPFFGYLEGRLLESIHEETGGATSE